MLSKSERKRAEKEAENIKPGDRLGHNTKLLRDGETLQRRLDHNIRVQYVVEE